MRSSIATFFVLVISCQSAAAEEWQNARHLFYEIQYTDENADELESIKSRVTPVNFKDEGWHRLLANLCAKHERHPTVRARMDSCRFTTLFASKHGDPAFWLLRAVAKWTR